MTSRNRHLAELDVEIRIGTHTYPLTLDVFGWQQPGQAPSREQPEEKAGHIIERVMLETHDITNALPTNAIRDIAGQLDQVVPL
jgi:hypothetical protein